LVRYSRGESAIEHVACANKNVMMPISLPTNADTILVFPYQMTFALLLVIIAVIAPLFGWHFLGSVGRQSGNM
jgi:hypothetical protein